MVKHLTHGRIRLALHTLQDGPQPRLLLLHGLGEQSPLHVPEEYKDWPGGIYALDFTGHGQSTVPRGGGYTAELLIADVDIALAELDGATLLGRGLGAYIATLTAGSRPELVKGVVVLDGTGLAGGGAGSSSPYIGYPDPNLNVSPDPFAILELTTDVRPADYCVEFVKLAMEYSGLERPISVCSCERVPWLTEIVGVAGVEVTSLDEALKYYSTRQ